jgi:hypothetical protein
MSEKWATACPLLKEKTTRGPKAVAGNIKKLVAGRRGREDVVDPRAWREQRAAYVSTLRAIFLLSKSTMRLICSSHHAFSSVLYTLDMNTASKRYIQQAYLIKVTAKGRITRGTGLIWTKLFLSSCCDSFSFLYSLVFIYLFIYFFWVHEVGSEARLNWVEWWGDDRDDASDI